MGKRPADQFYFGDYQRDTRALSLPARGAWMDILSAMFFAEPRGRLTLPIEGYARLFGCDVKTASSVILEIVALGVADCHVKGGILDPEEVPDFRFEVDPDFRVVTNGNGRITLICRRWEKAEKIKNQGRIRQSRYREKQKDNGGVTPPSSSSSSFSLKDFPDFQENPGSDGPFYLTKKGRKLEGVLLTTFNGFWIEYNFKHGKAEAADAWIDLAKMFGRKEFIEIKVPEILQAARVESQKRPTIEGQGKTPKWAQGWLTSRRFEDESYKTFGRSRYDPRPGEETPSEKMARWKRECEEEENASEENEGEEDERGRNEEDD